MEQRFSAELKHLNKGTGKNLVKLFLEKYWEIVAMKQIIPAKI